MVERWQLLHVSVAIRHSSSKLSSLRQSSNVCRRASLRSAALAGSTFIYWSFSDKIFVSRRNFLKTIRSPVESVWERNPLASTAFCGFSSSALITADNLPGRFLCVAKQQDHLGSLSFGHSCAGLPNISFWILTWLLWTCEPDMNVYSLSSSEKTCSFCDIFHRVSNDTI